MKTEEIEKLAQKEIKKAAQKYIPRIVQGVRDRLKNKTNQTKKRIDMDKQTEEVYYNMPVSKLRQIYFALLDASERLETGTHIIDECIKSIPEGLINLGA